MQLGVVEVVFAYVVPPGFEITQGTYTAIASQAHLGSCARCTSTMTPWFFVSCFFCSYGGFHLHDLFMHVYLVVLAVRACSGA